MLNQLWKQAVVILGFGMGLYACNSKGLSNSDPSVNSNTGMAKNNHGLNLVVKSTLATESVIVTKIEYYAGIPWIPLR